MIYIAGYASILGQADIADHTRDLVVNCAGYYENVSGEELHHDRPCGRKDYLLMWSIRGSEYQVRNGKEVELKAGWASLFRPREPQYCHRRLRNSSVFWIHFTGRDCELLLEQCGLKAGTVFEVGVQPELIPIFMRIINEINLKKSFSEELCALQFRQILFSFGRGMQSLAGASTRSADLFAELAEYIHTHYAERLTVDGLAAKSGMSKFAFIRAFKSAMGFTPIDYIIRLRIQKARELLARTNVSVKSTALTTGFRSPYYFSRLFKAHEGVSPQTYMRRFR